MWFSVAKQNTMHCKQHFQGKEPDRDRFTRLWAELIRRRGQ